MTACLRRSCLLLRPAVAAAAMIGLALVPAGCGGRDRDVRPALLLDGSAPPLVPAVLHGVGRGAVASRVLVHRVAQLDTRGRACLDGFRPEFRIPPRAVVVERTGVLDANLTFLAGSRRVVLGCDRTSRPGATGPWCARSVGRLFSGHLRDPRVDILCRTAGGDRMGLGWIQPAAGVRWVVVRNGPDAEVEQVAGGLPVRVSTTDVSIADSSAAFDVTEYGPDGKEVRRYRLRARVAG